MQESRFHLVHFRYVLGTGKTTQPAAAFELEMLDADIQLADWLW